MAGSSEGHLFRGIDRMSFVCPMTNSIFVEPVVAEDGHTYSKQAILAYFASCKERDHPIISPVTREKISEKLVPNSGMAKDIAEYRAKTGKETLKVDALGSEPLATPTCLAELGTMFSLLDGLRELLAETLDGWQPPQLIVVGQVLGSYVAI